MTDTAFVQLAGGHVTRISACDWPLVREIRWHAQEGRGTLYAAGKIAGKKVYLHRLITACPTGLVVDHADGDGLNNTRENLRVTTFAHNAANCAPFGIVCYRGVTTTGRRFRARINGTHIGYFATAQEAAIAYDEAALAEWGPFAWLNFPDLRPAEARTPDPEPPVPF